MRRRVLIIGSKGMAGHVIYLRLTEKEGLYVEDISRSVEFFTSTYKLDVTDFKSLKKILVKGNYDIVINCIGILNQFAEERPDLAVLLNGYLPQFLGNLGNELGFKLIHISTDCVFSGDKGGYIESDIKDGTGFYAQSKALGELDTDNHLTIRTSIIGPELKNGIGLFNWFMGQEGPLNGYTQAWWSGVTTIELANYISEVLDKPLNGLVHLTNGHSINKFDLLRLFNQFFRNPSVEIHPYDGKKVDKSFVNTRSDNSYLVPGYDQMIDEMSRWIRSRSNLYSSYL
jgi:dTDP-4-dehydrorhamnose reductase